MRRSLLVALLVGPLLAGCASEPSAAPTSSAATSASTASPTASAPSRPTAACPTSIPPNWQNQILYGPGGKRLPSVAITLTCRSAVAAAWAAFGSPADVSTVTFGYGAYCGDEPCPAMPPNNGYVAFGLRDGRTVVVGVQSDSAGTVTTDHPMFMQTLPPISGGSPSP